MRPRNRIALLVALPLWAAASLAQIGKTRPPGAAADRPETLSRFIAKKKFIEEGFYRGATNERDRLRYEAQVNELARSLSRLPAEKQTKAVVLGMFRLTMAEFEGAGSQERDRFLGYLEELMDIFGVESSDGLLNNWRYGFDPSEPVEVANAKAIAAMTPDERSLLERLKNMTAANALETLRSVLGAPATETAVARIWVLTPDASSTIGLFSQAGATVFTWSAKGRFSYSRRL